MRNIILTLFALLFSVSFAQADVYAEFGTAVAHANDRTFESGAKNLEFGYTNGIAWGRFQSGLGGWEDRSGYPGAKGSVYGQFSLGLEPDLGNWYVNYFFGPAFISTPDSLLGSRWHFYQEIGLGVKDYHDRRIGIVLKHMSNAGIIRPNKGRNFLVLRVGFRP